MVCLGLEVAQVWEGVDLLCEVDLLEERLGRKEELQQVGCWWKVLGEEPLLLEHH